MKTAHENYSVTYTERNAVTKLFNNRPI